MGKEALGNALEDGGDDGVSVNELAKAKLQVDSGEGRPGDDALADTEKVETFVSHLVCRNPLVNVCPTNMNWAWFEAPSGVLSNLILCVAVRAFYGALERQRYQNH